MVGYSWGEMLWECLLTYMFFYIALTVNVIDKKIANDFKMCFRRAILEILIFSRETPNWLIRAMATSTRHWRRRQRRRRRWWWRRLRWRCLERPSWFLPVDFARYERAASFHWNRFLSTPPPLPPRERSTTQRSQITVQKNFVVVRDEWWSEEGKTEAQVIQKIQSYDICSDNKWFEPLNSTLLLSYCTFSLIK